MLNSKGRRSRTSDFAIEQELQEFKIKFADSEQQLTAWKKKFEELGYVRDSLEEKVELKNDQVQSRYQSHRCKGGYKLWISVGVPHKIYMTCFVGIPEKFSPILTLCYCYLASGQF